MHWLKDESKNKREWNEKLTFAYKIILEQIFGIFAFDYFMFLILELEFLLDLHFVLKHRKHSVRDKKNETSKWEFSISDLLWFWWAFNDNELYQFRGKFIVFFLNLRISTVVILSWQQVIKVTSSFSNASSTPSWLCTQNKFILSTINTRYNIIRSTTFKRWISCFKNRTDSLSK